MRVHATVQDWSRSDRAGPRLIFTSDRVVIRRVERYDLAKIKQTESEAEHWFCLWLRRLRSSENCIVGVSSKSGWINQWQCSILGLEIGWVFRFCFRLRQPSFQWIISDVVANGSESEEMETFWFFRLRFCRAYNSTYDSDIRFSLGHKLSYDSDYDTDSVATENQPLNNTHVQGS